MIQLYNDDCLNVLDTLIQQGIKVDSIITDIPYFQVVKNSWDNQWKNEKEYLEWVEVIVQKCDILLKDNASLLLFTGRQYNRKICNILDNYFEEKRIIIWARKRAFNNTRGKALASGYEPICYYTKGNNPTFNNIKIKVDSKRPEYTTGYLKDGITLSDVWSDISALPHNSKEKVNHPTQKPIKLMERCILLTTNEKDTVLDFCMGSGTTGIACKNTNRNFIGVEIDKDYFNMAKNRIEQN
ncbi:MAG: site-specific DNA-methyltransferase [Bacilli bacterium]|nr:site-specific DNA-methyltransferase [Bacilli bacterium]